MKKVWTKTKKISGKYKIEPSPILEIDNNIINEPVQVANLLAEHFANVGEKINRREEFKRHKIRMEGTPILLPVGEEEEYNEPITKAELMGVLKQTKETSPGKDEITYSMIKNADETLQELLLKLYNKIFTQHQFPEKWLLSIVIPILKQGKDPKVTDSYRPIALISWCSWVDPRRQGVLFKFKVASANCWRRS